MYIFDIKTDRFSDFSYKCEKFDIDSVEADLIFGRPIAFPEEIKDREKKKLTKEEKKILEEKYNKCISEERKRAEENFKKKKKMDIADGFSFLFVGLILLYFYHRRK